ncbi:MAG: DUF3597 domain-containing protein [Anaerolineales bacterium]
MNLFSKILNKLGFDKPQEEAASKEKTHVQKSLADAAADRTERLERIKAVRAERTSKEIPLVDVVEKLEKMAAEKPMELNWKVSIADLLFLLDLDNSYEARKELAVELGCPAEKMDDSAQMNTWLHKTVLEKIAENGGNVPMELLD